MLAESVTRKWKTPLKNSQRNLKIVVEGVEAAIIRHEENVKGSRWIG